MPVHSKSQINLIPKSEFETSFFGRLLKWSLTSGRYIIILTEMVVIVAFLSRFKLDKDLIDLTETIEGQKAILESSSTIETTFRKTQSRLNEAGRILKIQPHPSVILSNLINQTPLGIYFDSVAISTQKNEITLQGNADSENSLGTFIKSLKHNGNWTSVNLTNVASRDNQVVTFSLTIIL
jgi:Tfp pilus assembly protein PilN